MQRISPSTLLTPVNQHNLRLWITWNDIYVHCTVPSMYTAQSHYIENAYIGKLSNITKSESFELSIIFRLFAFQYV